jgi:hypothetical protein
VPTFSWSPFIPYPKEIISTTFATTITATNAYNNQTNYP